MLALFIINFCLCLLLGGSAEAGITATVRNCTAIPTEHGKKMGSLEVISPANGQTYSGSELTVEIRTSCPAESFGIPFVLFVDVPYYPKQLPPDGSRVFVPHRAQPNLPCCQTGGQGLLAYRLKVPLGNHVLTVGPGYQGTSLPTFDPVEVAFSVGAALPMTGTAITAIGIASILILVGGLVLFVTRHRATEAA